MTQYLKIHEKYIMDMLNSNQITNELLDYHRTQIEHVKHERLVHLIVMSLFAMLLLTTLIAFLQRLVYFLVWLSCYFLLRRFFTLHIIID